jgi:hypothetical protein
MLAGFRGGCLFMAEMAEMKIWTSRVFSQGPGMLDARIWVLSILFDIRKPCFI